MFVAQPRSRPASVSRASLTCAAACVWLACVWLVAGSLSAPAAPPVRPTPAPPPEALEMPAIFSDHMVLQQQMPVPVWGRTRPGQKVTVRFKDQERTATAGPDGRWMVKLDPLTVEKQPQELSVSDATGGKTFTDVLVGEVWFGSGQSNMEFAWSFSDEAQKREAAKKKKPEKPNAPAPSGGHVDKQTLAVLQRAVGNPLIRVSSKTRDHLTTPNTGWALVDDVSVRTLPALPGCIAVSLQEELDVPVGIIVRAVSGTAACRWVSESAYMNDPLVKRQLEVFTSQGGKRPTGVRFGDLYATYVLPVVPYAIRGVLWDQGEYRTGVRISNELVGRTPLCSLSDWTPMMHALVTEWRGAWGQGDLPWSATDHYPDALEARLEQAGIVNFKVAKTDGLSRALHPLNKWRYAQKHLDNIFPLAYGREAPAWPAAKAAKR